MASDDAARPAADTLPLIPRTAFFGNPARAAGRISPDGRWLSWLADRNGVLNIWVAPTDTPGAARALTDERGRPVASYFWSADGAMVLYLTDPGGHENLQLYGADPASGERRALTRFENSRVQAPKLSHRFPDRILIQANNRDPRWFDVLSLDLATGALTTVFENDAYGGFVADEDLNLRLATRPTPSGDLALHRITDGKAEAEPYDAIPFEDVSSTGPLAYSFDGATLYWRDSRGRDTAALIAEAVATGAKTVLAEDARADLGELLLDPKTGRAQAYAAHYLRPEWIALDPAIAGDLEFLGARFAGADVTVTSRTNADDQWTIAVTAADAPGEAWLYERTGRALTKLYTTRPELDGLPLAPMLPFEVAARDGWTLVSYLTLPPGADPGGDARPANPLPMVLFVHGGPWGRDYYGYNAVHQWLANRGYAVLSVNFRGSAGLGKAFCAAGDREWGARMQDDLLDAVAWAVARGVTAQDQVAIFGGSYGGYATLAGLAFTPDAFVCGVDLFGPSNLNSLLATTPSYWASQLAILHRRMGDPATPEGRALLQERSPVFSADAIVRPLLIAQGANDARVKQAESDQIVEAMQARQIPVTYLLFDDEGHGFARPDNNLAFFAATELFLAQHLGGRAEPMPASLPGATMRVVEGGHLVPGLERAGG